MPPDKDGTINDAANPTAGPNGVRPDRL